MWGDLGRGIMRLNGSIKSIMRNYTFRGVGKEKAIPEIRKQNLGWAENVFPW